MNYDVKTKNFLEVEKSWNNPYLINPEQHENQEQLLDKFEYWWTNRYRKQPSTAKDYRRDLWRMTTDKVYPINWLKPNPIQIIAHLDHYETKEHPWATINKWKSTKALMKSMGINTELWGYVPPSPPRPKVRIIPLPPTVYKYIHHKYTPNKYMNHLIQNILYFGHIVGPRPEEIPILKTTDCYINDGYIIITEPKKKHVRRQLFPETELLINPRRKSLKNWMIWRKQVANNQSQNYLYLQHNGRPWTINYLRKIINQYVKPVWPDYTMYNMRHWCAIARLIKTKVDNGSFDTWEVKEWLGHDDESTTKWYLRFAKKYYRLAPYDWISALLKFQKERYKGIEIENYIKQPWFRVEPTGVERYGPAEGETNLLPLKSLKNTANNSFSTSTFSFSFFQSPNFAVDNRKEAGITNTTIFEMTYLFHSLPPYCEYDVVGDLSPFSSYNIHSYLMTEEFEGFASADPICLSSPSIFFFSVEDFPSETSSALNWETGWNYENNEFASTNSLASAIMFSSPNLPTISDLNFVTFHVCYKNVTVTKNEGIQKCYKFSLILFKYFHL